MLACKPSLKTVDSLFFTGEKEHARKSVSFAEQRSQTQRKRTESLVGSFDGPVIDIALVACGLSSTLFFSQNAASRSSRDLKSPLYQSLPLNVKYIVDIKSDLTSLACANGTNVAKYGDLVALVWDLKTNKRSVTPFQVQGMELTMPCLRETVMNVHNLGGLLPIEATASGSLFVKTQIEFVGLTKPTFIVVEMTPVHAHSDNSHTTVARDFFNIGYYTHVTERISSAFCGDMTDQSRWILFGHKFPGPSFDMLAYCNKSYPVGVKALDDIGDLPLNLWRNNKLEFRVRGEDDYASKDPHTEKVTLVGPERLTLRVPCKERRVRDFCLDARLQLTHALSHHVQQGVAKTLTEVTSIRVPKAERVLEDVRILALGGNLMQLQPKDTSHVDLTWMQMKLIKRIRAVVVELKNWFAQDSSRDSEDTDVAHDARCVRLVLFAELRLAVDDGSKANRHIQWKHRDVLTIHKPPAKLFVWTASVRNAPRRLRFEFTTPCALRCAAHRKNTKRTDELIITERLVLGRDYTEIPKA